MKILRLITFSLLFAFLLQCKPRIKSSNMYGMEDSPDDRVNKAIFIEYFKNFSNNLGITVNNHPFYKKIITEIIDTYRGTEISAYRLKMDGINATITSMIKRGFNHITESDFVDDAELVEAYDPPLGQGRRVDLVDIVKKSYLDFNLSLEQCTNDDGTARRQRVCFSFESCEIAMTALQDVWRITRFLRETDSAVTEVGNLLSELERDVKCLTPSVHRNLLENILAGSKLQFDFYKYVNMELYKRPEFKNDYFPANLKSAIEQLVHNTEEDYLYHIDPTRLRPHLINSLKTDLAVRPFIDPEYELNVQPTDSMVQLAEMRCVGERCQDLQHDMPEVAKEAVQVMTDNLQQLFISSHVLNRAMLFLIERITNNNYPSLLASLVNQAKGWKNWYIQGHLSKKSPRPDHIKHISPMLAFLMLATYSETETVLPFRKNYLLAMQELANNLTMFVDQGTQVNNLEFTSRSKSTAAIVDGLRKTVDIHEDNIIKIANSVGLIGTNILNKEQYLANSYPKSFHSVMDSFNVFLAKSAEQINLTILFNQAQKDAMAKKLLEFEIGNNPEEFARKSQDSLMNAIQGSLELACLSYALDENYIQYYNTGINKIYSSCLPFIYKLFKTGFGDTDFQVEDGFVGDFPLSRVCLKPGKGHSPFSYTAFAKIRRNTNQTLECTEETLRRGQEGLVLLVSLATMPLMGHVGGMATGVLITALRQTVATRIIPMAAMRLGSSEISKALLANSFMRWQSRALGKVVVAGTHSLLMASFFEVASSIVMRPFGAPGLFELSFKERAKNIAKMTLIFSGLGLAHGLSSKGSILLASHLPNNLIWRFGINAGVPFLSTTAYFTFSEDLLYQAQESVKMISGIDLDKFVIGKDHQGNDLTLSFVDKHHLDKPLWEKVTHATLLTASFAAYGRLTRSFLAPNWQKKLQERNERIKSEGKTPFFENISLVQGAPRQVLNERTGQYELKYEGQWKRMAEQAEILRGQRVFARPKSFLNKWGSNFKVEPAEKLAENLYSAESKATITTPALLDGYSFLGMSAHMARFRNAEILRLINLMETNAASVTPQQRQRVQRAFELYNRDYMKELNSKWQRFEKRYQKAIANAKTPEERAILVATYDHVGNFYQSMRTFETRVKYDSLLAQLESQLSMPEQAFQNQATQNTRMLGYNY